MQELDSSSGLQTRRLIVWMGACLALYVGWAYIAPRPTPPPPEVELQRVAERITEESAADPGATAPAGPAAPAAPGETTEDAAARPRIEESAPRRVAAETPAFSVELSNVGGRLTSWKLLGEGDHGDPSRPLELVRRRVPPPAEGEPEPQGGALPASDEQDLLPLQVVTGDARLDATLARAVHVVSVAHEPGRRILTATWSDGAGTSIEKTLTLREAVPLATLQARLTVGGRPAPFRLAWGPGIGNHTSGSRSNMYFKRGAVGALRGEKVLEILRADKQDDLPESSVRWAALQDSYFAVLVTPAAMSDSTSGRARDGADTGFRVSGTLPPTAKGKPDKTRWPEEITLEIPFTPEADTQVIHAGPRHRPALRALDASFREPPRLAMVTHLGMLDGLATLLHVPLLKFHAWTGSWGWSVVLLTLLVRLVIAPLQFFSMKKMRGMQDKMKPVQAEVKALDERYRKLPPTRENRMKQMQEKQELMMSAGINPADTLSGCLPLLITMPVFFALLKLLPAAPEFRHEPFLFWNDLAASDPSHLLPIAAAVLTLVTTWMGMSSSAQSIDPMQRNMLLMFPLMLVWLCWSAPLAFVVYQVAMSAVQIGQQQLFNIWLPPADAGRTPARAGSGKAPPPPIPTTAGAPTPVEGRPAARKKGRKR